MIYPASQDGPTTDTASAFPGLHGPGRALWAWLAPQAPQAGTAKGPRKCLRSETILKYFRHLNTLFGEFPCSPAVTTSVSNARDAGSIPGQKANTPYVSTPKKTKHKTETSLEQIQ